MLQSEAPISIVRKAANGDHQIRVTDDSTNELYDLHISNGSPFAAPLNQQQQHQPHDEEDQRRQQDGSDPSRLSAHRTSSSSGPRVLRLPQILGLRNVGPVSSPNAFADGGRVRQELPPSPPPEPSTPTKDVEEGSAEMLDDRPDLPPQAKHASSYFDGPHSSSPSKHPNGLDSAGDVDGRQSADGASPSPPAPPLHGRRPSSASSSSHGRSSWATSTPMANQNSAASATAGSVTGSSVHSEFVDVARRGTPPTVAVTNAEPAGNYLHPNSAAGLRPVSSGGGSSVLSAGATATVDGTAPVTTSASKQQLPGRRNTTGSAGVAAPKRVRTPQRHSSQHAVSGLQSRAPATGSGSVGGASAPLADTGDPAFEDDVAKQAEEIRRQRVKKREKAALEQEAAGQMAMEDGYVSEEGGVRTRSRSVRRHGYGGEGDVPKVIKGNLISEGHANYVLMYNMLTGIRIGVSRCQAKIKRPLTDADYQARHKFTFDIVGNELTPSAKYDFKFKDYAPWVFRELREYFHLDPADYLLSLTAKYILSELGSPGKSGSFFYFSRDYRFIIKTIRHSEHKFLRSILKDYHEHVKQNPHTLLSRFYGLHRVKLPRGRKIHFVIMNNLFPPHRDIHETYDLKGSAQGREYPEEVAKNKPGAVLKDLNWVKRRRTLELGPEKRVVFEEQLKRDAELLKRLNIMDYSLLVGLHDVQRGNKENLRQDRLTVFQPETTPRRKPTQVKRHIDPTASIVRGALSRTDPKSLSSATTKLPDRDSSERRHFIFYQDEGGFRATDEYNRPGSTIYYLGIIDILTPYTSVKRAEHFWKGMSHDRHTISAVPPLEYGDRFVNFLRSIIRGGDKSSRPKGLEDPAPGEETIVQPAQGASVEMGAVASGAGFGAAVGAAVGVPRASMGAIEDGSMAVPLAPAEVEKREGATTIAEERSPLSSPSSAPAPVAASQDGGPSANGPVAAPAPDSLVKETDGVTPVVDGEAVAQKVE